MTEEVDDAVEKRLSTLLEHLEATEELPVTREASAWLGEAEAVARDAARGGPPEVVRKRVRQVRELLERIDGTEHPEADDRVAAAIDVAEELGERLG
jgi:hypothetical protein